MTGHTKPPCEVRTFTPLSSFFVEPETMMAWFVAGVLYLDTMKNTKNSRRAASRAYPMIVYISLLFLS